MKITSKILVSLIIIIMTTFAFNYTVFSENDSDLDWTQPSGGSSEQGTGYVEGQPTTYDGPVETDSLCTGAGEASGSCPGYWRKNDDPVIVAIVGNYGTAYNSFANQLLWEYKAQTGQSMGHGATENVSEVRSVLSNIMSHQT